MLPPSCLCVRASAGYKLSLVLTLKRLFQERKGVKRDIFRLDSRSKKPPNNSNLGRVAGPDVKDYPKLPKCSES